MLERAERWGPAIRTADATTAVGVLRSDMPDHRRAMEWFTDHEADAEAARLLVSLFQYAFFDLHVDVFRWAAAVVERTADGAPLRSEVFGAAALAAWFSGDTDRAILLGERAIDPGGGSTIWARTALVNAYGYTGRFDVVGHHYQALVDELTNHADPFWQINGIGYQTISLSMFGRHETGSGARRAGVGAVSSPRQPLLHLLGALRPGAGAGPGGRGVGPGSAGRRHADRRRDRKSLQQWARHHRVAGPVRGASATPRTAGPRCSTSWTC